MHTSISTHICAIYLDREAGTWGMNHECWQERVGSYPDRIENLLFLWSVLSRAISKSGDFLLSGNVCINPEEHDLIANMLEIVEKPYFDEKSLFSNELLKVSFRDRFRNLSRIMDCVECEKCKLWGKVQTMGLATALKLLYSDTTAALTTAEYVSLLNVYHRITSSIRYSQIFQYHRHSIPMSTVVFYTAIGMFAVLLLNFPSWLSRRYKASKFKVL